jgi:hypothetical protein
MMPCVPRVVITDRRKLNRLIVLHWHNILARLYENLSTGRDIVSGDTHSM